MQLKQCLLASGAWEQESKTSQQFLFEKYQKNVNLTTTCQ
jgi:hypothetical protein